MAGLGGSGKSTLARRLSTLLDLPLHVLDDLYYGPDLSMREEFPADIEAITGGDRWIFDSQGTPLESPAPEIHREHLWSRADTLVWLDYPRHVLVARGARRHLRRVLTRERLWGGYVETPRAWLDPSHPVRRAWRLHGTRRAQLESRCAEPRWQPLTVVRLRHPRDVDMFLADLARRQQAPGPSG